MNRRGFTLIELAITIAIVGLVAMVGVASWRSLAKNAAAGSAGLNVAAQLDGLRAVAMREGVPYGALVMDTTNNDPGTCMANPRDCLRICVVRDPPAGWSAATVNVLADALGDCTSFTNGTRFQLTNVNAPPAPFNALPVNDPVLVPLVSGRRVLALRFETNGIVTPAVPNPGPVNGVAIAIGSDALNANLTEGVVVSFPYGLVRTYSF